MPDWWCGRDRAGLRRRRGLLTALVGTSLSYSTLSMVVAFASSTLIGVGFGFVPARAVARLDPLNALARV